MNIVKITKNLWFQFIIISQKLWSSALLLKPWYE